MRDDDPQASGLCHDGSAQNLQTTFMPDDSTHSQAGSSVAIQDRFETRGVA